VPWTLTLGLKTFLYVRELRVLQEASGRVEGAVRDVKRVGRSLRPHNSYMVNNNNIYACVGV
jgi:hypothetical protein